jgi:hypothetical protein
MTNTNLSNYKDFRVGQVLTETLKNNRTKLILIKGIYTDDKGVYHLGMQYIDRKASRQNKRTTVSGKSPFWFEPIS